MSQLVATIKKINSIDNLNIVEFDFHGLTLKMMSLDLNTDVQVGKKVKLSVKPTNISIAKNLIGEISLSNQIVATIENLENGVYMLNINQTRLIRFACVKFFMGFIAFFSRIATLS